MDVIDKAEVSPSDMRLLIDRDIIRIEGKRVIWDDPNMLYEWGEFDHIRILAEAGNLYYHRNRFLIWAFPPKVFETFTEVYVLTYLFDAQVLRYYYDLYEIPYKKYSLIDREMAEYDVRADKREELFELINLYEGDHNRHGD